MPELTEAEATVSGAAAAQVWSPDPAAAADPPGTGAQDGVPAPSGASQAAGQVGDFHRAYGLPLRVAPTVLIGADQVELRQALIEEEVAELAAAARDGDLVGVADALADIVYVAYGTAHVYGIDLDAVLDEVHASNMTKLGADGLPIRRPDGKILKGPDYRPPDVAGVLGRLYPARGDRQH